MGSYNLCQCGAQKTREATVCKNCRLSQRVPVASPCAFCGSPTLNPKFCSRSCAASSNNAESPKRALESLCGCGNKRSSWRSKLCDDCRAARVESRKENHYNTWTLGAMRGSGNANFNSRYPYIRNMSRKAYKDSGRPMKCLVCDYSLHVDIAHIRDVKSYPDSATVAEVNNLDNLIALCKNHHWEFDHGHLQIEGVSSETKPVAK